jgi:glutathione S-transferase
MYRAMPAEERARGIAQIARQLDVLEGLCEGPYLAGGTLTSADSAVFPTVVFMMQVPGAKGRGIGVCGRASAALGNRLLPWGWGSFCWPGARDLQVCFGAPQADAAPATQLAARLARPCSPRRGRALLLLHPSASSKRLKPPPRARPPPQMLPDVFGWEDVFAGRPKLAAWWQALQRDPAAVRVGGRRGSGLGFRARRARAASCPRLGCGPARWAPPLQPQVMRRARVGRPHNSPLRPHLAPAENPWSGY